MKMNQTVHSDLAISIFLAHKDYFSCVFSYIYKVLHSTKSYNNNKMPWNDNIRVFHCSPDITPGDKINLSFPVFCMIIIASLSFHKQISFTTCKTPDKAKRLNKLLLIT